MSNVVQLFNNNPVTVYRIVDPGVTWYEENQTVSAIQLKNDAATLECSVEDILDEMHAEII